QFCGMKGIKREFSVAKTPQQNGFAKRKNRTLIEAARTMLADSLLPISFWAEAVNIARYVQNRVLVTKPHNKTPYELLLGRTPSIGFMRPFGCPVTILNILDPLGKFDGKADEGFLVGYSISSKAFRVFNSRTRIVQETLHINFLENQPNVAGSGPTWLFDIDTLTQSMTYQPVGINQILVQNTDADATFKVKEPESTVHVSPSSSAKTKKHDDKTKREAKGKSLVELSTGVRNVSEEFEAFSSNRTNGVNVASKPVTAVEPNSTNIINTFSAAGLSNSVVSLTLGLDRQSSYVDPSQYPDDPDMSALEDITYSDDEEDVGVEADFSNLETNITVSPIPTTRIHKDHPVTQIIGDLSSAPQTWSMTRMVKEQDPDYPDKVYKVVKALYGLHQAPRACQDKYVAEILRKFGLADGKSASTPIDTEKPLLKDPDGEDVDIHTYRLMIGSLMYLTSSRPDIMFAVCACARFQVTPKASHVHAVKRIFRYLKGKPHLGLWYPKDSPFNLVAYSDSDYAGASLDRNSTTRGCQFLGCRLISWQCKKQTGVATSFIEAEYVAAASCCAQVLWIQN
nr:zinc finger, CCHC-type [Tanacetum cinerariifolium]